MSPSRVSSAPRRRLYCLAITGLLTLALLPAASLPAFAQEAESEENEPEKPDESWIISLQFSNDMFGGSDRHFTHGTRFSALSPEGHVPEFIESAAKALPLFPEDGNLRVSYSLGQDIFTPERIEERDLIKDDRPYAGWLYGGVGLVSENGSRLDQLELNVGIVGPASLAEQVQTEWHRLLDLTIPEGWDNQLENEPGIVLYYERKWRNLWETKVTDLEVLDELAFDITPHLGGALGNVYTYGAGGLTLRVGEDLPSDYGPPKLRPNLPGSDYFRPDDTVGWYLFAGVEGRLVLQNIFLDGNTFEDSHSVDKRRLVGDLQAGLAITLGKRVRLAYTHLWRTEEFREQDAPDQFGTLSMSVRF